MLATRGLRILEIKNTKHKQPFLSTSLSTSLSLPFHTFSKPTSLHSPSFPLPRPFQLRPPTGLFPHSISQSELSPLHNWLRRQYTNEVKKSQGEKEGEQPTEGGGDAAALPPPGPVTPRKNYLQSTDRLLLILILLLLFCAFVYTICEQNGIKIRMPKMPEMPRIELPEMPKKEEMRYRLPEVSFAMPTIKLPVGKYVHLMMGLIARQLGYDSVALDHFHAALKYIPTRYQYMPSPPVSNISRLFHLVQSGELTAEKLTTLLMEQGYLTETASALLEPYEYEDEVINIQYSVLDERRVTKVMKRSEPREEILKYVEEFLEQWVELREVDDALHSDPSLLEDEEVLRLYHYIHSNPDFLLLLDCDHARSTHYDFLTSTLKDLPPSTTPPTEQEVQILIDEIMKLSVKRNEEREEQYREEQYNEELMDENAPPLPDPLQYPSISSCKDALRTALIGKEELGNALIAGFHARINSFYPGLVRPPSLPRFKPGYIPPHPAYDGTEGDDFNVEYPHEWERNLYYRLIIDLHQRRGGDREAVKAVDKLIQDDMLCLHLYTVKLGMLERLGRSEEEIIKVKGAIWMLDRSEERMLEAVTYFHQQDPRGGTLAFNKYVNKYPTAEKYLDLGDLYFLNLEDIKAAEQCYVQSLVLHPSFEAFVKLRLTRSELLTRSDPQAALDFLQDYFSFLSRYLSSPEAARIPFPLYRYLTFDRLCFLFSFQLVSDEELLQLVRQDRQRLLTHFAHLPPDQQRSEIYESEVYDLIEEVIANDEELSLGLSMYRLLLHSSPHSLYELASLGFSHRPSYLRYLDDANHSTRYLSFNVLQPFTSLQPLQFLELPPPSN